MRLKTYNVVEEAEGDIISLTAFSTKEEAQELMLRQVAENTGMDPEADGFKEYVEECQEAAFANDLWMDLEGNYTVAVIESD